MNEEYLQHYGVKGMKWGVRHDRKSSNPYRANVKSARRNEKLAGRDLSLATPVGSALLGLRPDRHSEAGKRYDKALDNYVNKRQKRIEAQAAYARAKAKNPRSAERAERKVYKKAMKEVGLRDSLKDTSSNGAGKKLYNSIKQTKGKKYADSLESSVSKEAYAQVAVGTAVAIGSYAVSMYLADR